MMTSNHDLRLRSVFLARSLAGAVLMGLILVSSGCASLRPDISQEETFGHRVTGNDPEGRTTIAVTPPREDTDYRLFDATYESVTIRPATVTPDNRAEGVAVEVLVKGAFPDACSELHDVTQQRAGNLILVTLTMRRPQGSVCASVLRPYRYYLDLDGSFVPGSYSLKLNDASHGFEVREPRDS